jgi:uncharacterized membrane protein (UPF0136 family)
MLAYHTFLSWQGFRLHQTIYRQSDAMNYIADAESIIDFVHHRLLRNWDFTGLSLYHSKSPRALVASLLFTPFVLFFGNGFLAWMAIGVLVLWCIWQAAIVVSATFRVPFVLPILSFAGLPSFAIWQGGLFKESLATACMCLLIVVTSKLQSKISFKLSLLFPAVSWMLLFLLLWLLKFYIALLFVPAVLLSFSAHQTYSRRIAIPTVLSVIGLLVTMYLFKAMPSFDDIPEAIRLNHSSTLAQRGNGSLITYPALPDSPMFFRDNFLYSLWLGLAGPPISLSNGLIYNYVASERILVCFTMLCFVAYLIGKRPLVFRKFETIVWISFVLFSAITIAYSTPNMGALCRYQSLYMPVLVFMAAFAFYRAKVESPLH